MLTKYFEMLQLFTLLHQPSFFHWIEKCVHEIIAIIFRYFERFFFDVIIQILEKITVQLPEYNI